MELSQPADPVTEKSVYKKGYSNPVGLRKVIAQAHKTQLWRTTALAAFDHLAVPTLLLGGTSPTVQAAGWLVFGVIVILAIVVSARQLRALECLIHEASHFNWSRHHRKAGDVLAALLAGVPTGVRIADYRESHLVHHSRFGTLLDPDRKRYEDLNLEDLDRSGIISYTYGLLRRFGSYQRGWLRSLGSTPTATALPFAWCLAIIVLPGWLMEGWFWAGTAGMAWLFTHLVTLPMLRFIGESSEHVYREADTVFEATISNLGLLQRLLIHPHGDGYHTIHHMWPGVPHHQLARLHQILLTHDEEYRSKLRHRIRVLESPRKGV